MPVTARLVAGRLVDGRPVCWREPSAVTEGRPVLGRAADPAARLDFVVGRVIFR